MDKLLVELAGDVPGTVQRVWDRHRTRCASATFALPGGLPKGAWVVLRDGDEWIDKRFLSVPWSRGSEAGLEFVVEPGTRLEVLIADREGPQIEFKRQVPTDDAGRAKVMKTVCAFANGGGGSILFGIDDDHNVVGVPAARADRMKDQLTEVVGRWVEPRPIVSFEVLPLDDPNVVVLELQVPAGTSLHGSAKPGDVPAAYIRHHAISVRARPAEIEGIVRSRTPNASAPSWALR